MNYSRGNRKRGPVARGILERFNCEMCCFHVPLFIVVGKVNSLS